MDTSVETLKIDSESCWLSLDSQEHFDTMDNIDERYREIREAYQSSLGDSYSQTVLETLLNTRGVATRESLKAKGVTDNIPAGLNLGGLCLMKMPESILLFHRIKLRNNTSFRINMLDIDLMNMVLTTRISLHDLHLAGAYGRLLTDKEPGLLYYTPTYGEAEFLLKDASFKAEGRLRLVKDRLWIELIDSKITTGEKLMTYTSDSTSIYLRPGSIEDLVERMKTDLQKWLKDYFNDFFMFHPLNEPPNNQFRAAENERTTVLNDYADYAIRAIVDRIRKINASSVQLPTFVIRSSNQMTISIYDGTLQGLDSMYRRSLAMGKKEGKLRKVDTMIGFSSLKVIYKYDAQLPLGISDLHGALILTSDDLTGHLAISLVKDPETVDIKIDSIEQTNFESLTVEGFANRFIASYKHILQNHIIAIMTNTLHYELKMLRSLPKCTPNIKGVKESNEQDSKEDDFSQPENITQNQIETETDSGFFENETDRNISSEEKDNYEPITYPSDNDNTQEDSSKENDYKSQKKRVRTSKGI